MRWLKRKFSGSIVIVVMILGLQYAQELQDWTKLLLYRPPAQVARLAAATTMTDTAQRLFYVNQPKIETRKSAANLCRGSEHTVILGCYVSGTGIFIQSIPDPRLEGIMEVTAAHEMLHVVYQRMSFFQQSQINKQLRSVFSQLKSPRLKESIQNYDEKDIDTELHSILGTEARNLTPELEAHYRKYFNDRLQIVALSERYEGVFSSIRDRIKIIRQELATRKLTREQLIQQVDAEAASIESEKSYIQTMIATNPQGDYNSRVSSLTDRVRNYNQQVNILEEQTNSYNQLVNEHNSLTLEEKSLVESMENKK